MSENPDGPARIPARIAGVAPFTFTSSNASDVSPAHFYMCSMLFYKANGGSMPSFDKSLPFARAMPGSVLAIQGKIP